jgi:gliding motility-associated-like protein
MPSEKSTLSFTCTQTPIRFIVKLAYKLTRLEWDISKTGGGIYPSADSILTNPVPVDSGYINGRKYYYYTLQQDYRFTTPGTYYLPYAYTAPDVDQCNNTEKATIEVIVKSGPTTNFSISGGSCLENSFTFTGSSNPAGYNITDYLWSFDDSTYIKTINATKQFTTTGDHEIFYQIIADNGCTGEKRDTATVLPQVASGFFADVISCQKDSVLITDTSKISSGSITNWHWIFDDGNVVDKSTGVPFYHHYGNAGTYNIKLITTSGAGCLGDTATRTVTINETPVAKFSTDKAGTCVNDAILFTDNSTPSSDIVEWKWIFGDGVTLIKTNNSPFNYTYINANNYTAKLVTKSSKGCQSDTFYLPVIIASKPVSSFTATASICKSDSILITDNSSVATGAIANWHWIFGDGNILDKINESAFYYHYTTAGNFIVQLVVSSTQSCNSDTLKQMVTVTEAPTSKFIVNKNICLGDSVLITDQSTIPSSSILQWQWDFGDGNSVTKNFPTPFYYTYKNSGSFTVKLVAKSVNGCSSAVYTQPVVVASVPVSSFTIAGKPCLDSNIVFTSGTNYNAAIPTNWYWNFGDGNIANMINSNTAAHTYNTTLTNLMIKHAVSNGGCVSDTTTIIIPAINANPTAFFLMNTNKLCTEQSVDFTAPANPNVSKWIWDFGNGTGNNVPSFSRAYNNAGSFTIKLIVQTLDGCGSSQVSNSLAVSTTPNINAGQDLYIKSGSSKTIQATVANASQLKFLWKPATFLGSTSVLTPVTTPLNDISYTVQATDKISGCTASDSVLVKVVTEIYVPNAFTPNGDGKNDTWGIPALALYPAAIVTIYNRYGQIIFLSQGYGKPWDGAFQGKPQPIGAYIYTIKPDENPLHLINGTVMLVR